MIFDIQTHWLTKPGWYEVEWLVNDDTFAVDVITEADLKYLWEEATSNLATCLVTPIEL